jgi:hypothetical protein
MSHTSDTSKRAEASRVNGARSSGPKTVDGKDRSRFNALKHGMRARTAFLPGEDPAAFQARRDAWTAQLQPRDDYEKLLVERVVQISWQLDRVDRAQAARLDDRARSAASERATAEADEVLVLARRLFWDPRGPVEFYPQFEKPIGDPMHVSWSADIEDPDEPARLVNRLENRLLGCAWMLDRWGDLRDLIVDGLKWQAPDRFMAIRLLAKQPLDPIRDEPVRAVYLCCKAIDPEGEHEYQDVSNELHAGERKRFIERNDERGLLEQMPADAETARTILLALVDSRVERLEDLLRRHQERDAASSVDRFGFDDSREGEQLRRYQLGCNRALIRILDTFWKYRRETERAASGEGPQRAGTHRRGRTDGGSGQGNPPTEPQGMTEVIPAVSQAAAPRIDDPSPATDPDAPPDPPPVAPSSSTEPAPAAATPPDQPLADQKATNEPTSPTEGPHHPIGTTILTLLALLVGLGLTAVFAASVKGIETSPPPQKREDASKAQVLLLQALETIDRPSLPATMTGRPASGRSTGRRLDLAADTLVESSPQHDETRTHAPTYQSRPPNQRHGPATG